MTTSATHNNAASTEAPMPAYSCPSWCRGGHQEALHDGASHSLAARHDSDQFGSRFYDVGNPVTGAVVRPGIGGWTAQVEKADTIGWQAIVLTRLEVDGLDHRSDAHPRVVLNLTLEETLAMGRALTHLAESGLLNES